jgi:hypothetical protein
MMLLMGMKMSLTKKPMKPMTINPMAVLIATFENSVLANNRNSKDSKYMASSQSKHDLIFHTACKSSKLPITLAYPKP